MSLPVAILAGGLATRLFPITEKLPKSLVRVAGEFFIVHQLHYLRQQGISRVVICLGHLGEQIEAAIGNGAAFNLDVRYSWDGSPMLGTGGALKKALPLLAKEFFILYGDSYLPVNFSEVERHFHESGQPVLMTVLKNSGQWDKSNVLLHKNNIIEYNKHQPMPEMEHIDYGLSVVSAAVFESVPLGEPFDLAILYHELSLRKALAGYEVFERFYEIGSLHGLSETRAKFLKDSNI